MKLTSSALPRFYDIIQLVEAVEKLHDVRISTKENRTAMAPSSSLLGSCE
jgi:hypothetical protein